MYQGQGQGRTSTHPSVAGVGGKEGVHLGSLTASCPVQVGRAGPGKGGGAGIGLGPSVEPEPLAGSRGGSSAPGARQVPLSSHCADEKVKAENGTVLHSRPQS